MAVLDASLLRRFEYLSLLARRSGDRSLAAGAHGTTPGGGTEVTGLRDYAPGDDYRHVDWTGVPDATSYGPEPLAASAI